jgi:hypothetical protein
MTREDIIELAREAQTHDPGFSVWILSTPHIERIVNRAVEAEREACARVCENGLPIASSMTALDDMEMWGAKFAAAIRARESK